MKKRVLLLCNIQKNSAETIVDHVNSFSLYSKHQIDVIDPVGATCLSDDLLENYDVVILHYSLAIVFDYYLSPSDRYTIKKFRGGKIMFIQDEYRWINLTVDCMSALGINTVFTCIPPHEINNVYSKEKLPNTKFINNLTGYVPERFLNCTSVDSLPGYDQRTNDVVYRGRKISAAYGKLVLEKYEIAQKFQDHAAPYGLTLDLAAREEDRIYGQGWIDFLKSSKASLGTESGASVFDFDDIIRPTVFQYEAENPGASYAEIEAKFFPGQDGLIKINQISPRVFEAIALKTLLVLYEGEYSGVIKPWQHFIPLKKDFSNIADVVKILKDPKRWQEMVDCAFNDIILSGKYSYQSFIEQVDREIDSLTATILAKNPSYSATPSNKSKASPWIVNYSQSFLNRGLRYISRKIHHPSIKNLMDHLTLLSSIYFYKANIFLNGPYTAVLCKNDSCCTNPKLKVNKYTVTLLLKKIKTFENCASCRWFLRGHSL